LTLVDANLLLYAYDATSRFNAAARSWLEEQLSGSALVGLPWSVILAFLRISTNARALQHPLSIEEATGIVASWLEVPCVVIPGPGAGHWDILAGLLAASQAKGPLVSDAHLAALTIEHGGVLATTDRDFTRFEGLRLLDPLRAP
jgi:toxin-antitoxin system PIN domain toxin